jgi:hypothetical protein
VYLFSSSAKPISIRACSAGVGPHAKEYSTLAVYAYPPLVKRIVELWFLARVFRCLAIMSKALGQSRTQHHAGESGGIPE